MQPSQPTLANVRAALERLGPGPWAAEALIVYRNRLATPPLYVRLAETKTAANAANLAAVLNFAAAMLPAIEALAAELDADADAERRSGRITPQPVRLRLHAAARRVVEAANNKGTL